MQEAIGDVFTYGYDRSEGHSHKIARAIPTNGQVTSGGRAVMGRGVALQAASRWRSVPNDLGALILSHGNHVHALPVENGPMFVSFPTKDDWRKPADLTLIERSARELLDLLDQWDDVIETVVMPRPGVGNGQLGWEQVRPVLRRVFGDDDRFVVVSLVDHSDPNDLPLGKKWR